VFAGRHDQQWTWNEPGVVENVQTQLVLWSDKGGNTATKPQCCSTGGDVYQTWSVPFSAHA
jgi:hypothetical protein